ncbi:MAG TPA: ABC transporter permease [Dictyobacter sp.]|nr:ABC transporter permease [Dictyobacter sp.]
MTFFALLTKELRLRMRRERPIWLMIAYILLLGALSWFSLNSTGGSTPNVTAFNQAGFNLFTLLSQLQLLFIIFITPSFIATTINSEKEHQTFDMLLCSRISAFSLVMGKLVAGLLHVLLIIASSLPLFSLVFFFGGITSTQILAALVIFLTTAFLLGAISLFCSTIIQRTAHSTTLVYLFCVLWLLLPIFIYIASLLTVDGTSFLPLYQDRIHLLLSWNPVIAMMSTYSQTLSYNSPLLFYLEAGYGFLYNANNGASDFVLLHTWHLSYGTLYNSINIALALLFCALSTLTVRPRMQELPGLPWTHWIKSRKGGT